MDFDPDQPPAAFGFRAAIQNVREVIALWLEHDAGTEVDPESFRVDDAA